MTVEGTPCTVTGGLHPAVSTETCDRSAVSHGVVTYFNRRRLRTDACPGWGSGPSFSLVEAETRVRFSHLDLLEYARFYPTDGGPAPNCGLERVVVPVLSFQPLQNEFRPLLIGTQPPLSAEHTAHNKVRTGQRSRRARRLGRRACKHHGPIRRCRRLWWWAGLSPSCHQPSHESSRPGGRTISLSLLSNRLYRISFRTTRYPLWTRPSPSNFERSSLTEPAVFP